jgi:hypothetical protein
MLRNIKRLNKFKVISLLTSGLYFYLFILLLMFPESLYKDVGITGSPGLYFLARRTSALMLGFAVLLFCTRNTLPSVARQAIAISVSINMLGFALSGTYGLICGIVNTSILNAIIIEICVAAAFFLLLISDRRQLKKQGI